MSFEREIGSHTFEPMFGIGCIIHANLKRYTVYSKKSYKGGGRTFWQTLSYIPYRFRTRLSSQIQMVET